jgi:hypothetical protein
MAIEITSDLPTFFVAVDLLSGVPIGRPQGKVTPSQKNTCKT